MGVWHCIHTLQGRLSTEMWVIAHTDPLAWYLLHLTYGEIKLREIKYIAQGHSADGNRP